MSRITCQVVYCRRTIAAEKLDGDNQWVCSKCWRLVPRSLKQRYSAERRQARKLIARKPLYAEWWKFPPGSPDRLAAVRMWKKLEGVWGECKQAAQEGAAGI